MSRAVKYLLFSIGGVVGLLLIGAVAFLLLFDPNDFRDRIAEETERKTGRELRIDGEIELTLFPWLAIGIGKTTLGNAPGFADEPFASFESARLSVRVLPMLLRREVSIGTAELDSLELNLAIAANGTTNWDDLVAAGEAAPAETPDAEPAGIVLDIANIELRNANIRYDDAANGDRYQLADVNLTSGRVAAGEPVPLAGGFRFELQPAAISGALAFETEATFDTGAASIRLADTALEATLEGLADVPVTLVLEAPVITADTANEILAPGALEFEVLDVEVIASIEPFSYAGDPEFAATLEVAAFSPRSLLERLAVEMPPTADPNAFGMLRLEAEGMVSTAAAALTNVELAIDETVVTGSLTLPLDGAGTIRFDLAGDTINLSRYMAPAEAQPASVEAEIPVEIPVELIRALNVNGSLELAEGFLGAMRFTNVDLGLTSAAGRLRIHPIAAELYDGTYSGDIRIDASGSVPTISVNEQLANVQLGALVAAMFEQENLSGTINGSFVLAGRGADLAAIQRDLDGKLSFELNDGAYEGTDLWYEVRRAYALVKQQPPPQPELPVRTSFSNVRVQGPVSAGVFSNPDLFAELPFMQIRGRGSVDLAAATMDYRLSARVLETPELVQAASAEEISDLTKAVIPLRITGPLSAPKPSVDIEGMLRERAEQEVDKLKDRLLDKVLGGDESGKDEDAEATDDGKKDAEDKLKESLRNIFKR